MIKTSEIEGEILNPDLVRSSVAKKLGLKYAGLINTDKNVEGIVDMIMDATRHSEREMTEQRLFEWNSSLFPDGSNSLSKIAIGKWRDDETGPMQVVSGPMGKERAHFEAPASERLNTEMTLILKWFNQEKSIDSIIKAAIAHLWFVTVHPFDAVNGRIARTIADMLLARADQRSQRYYSLSAQIRLERNRLYDILERTQKGSLDVTEWLVWFLACMSNALVATETSFENVLQKSKFWNAHSKTLINERQRLLINHLFDWFQGNLTSSKWTKIAKCSADTALRDIQDLMEKEILEKESSGGRSTHYVMKGFLDSTLK